MNVSKSSDADILKTIILKLQKRVEVGAATLLVRQDRVPMARKAGENKGS